MTGGSPYSVAGISTNNSPLLKNSFVKRGLTIAVSFGNGAALPRPLEGGGRGDTRHSAYLSSSHGTRLATSASRSISSQVLNHAAEKRQ